MLTTLALVVFFAAIVLFFSQELIGLIKKIFEIRGAKLFLPLAIASFAVYELNFWFLWIIFYYKDFLQSSWSLIHNFLPASPTNTSVSYIIVLTGVSVIPVVLWGFITRKSRYKGHAHSHVASILIWVISVMLFVLT
jgi:hypothetical protein